MERAWVLTEEEKKVMKNKLNNRFGPDVEVGVIKEVPIPNKYDVKIGEIVILMGYSPKKQYCDGVQFLETYRSLITDFPTDPFRILNKKTVGKLKSGSIDVIVEDNYAN